MIGTETVARRVEFLVARSYRHIDQRIGNPFWTRLSIVGGDNRVGAARTLVEDHVVFPAAQRWLS